MVKVPSIEECSRRRREGMLRTPFVQCPACGRKTRSQRRCQWCKTEWKSK